MTQRTVLIVTEQNLTSDGRACRFAKFFHSKGFRVVGAGFEPGPRNPPPVGEESSFDEMFCLPMPRESRLRAPLTGLVNSPATVVKSWGHIAYWLVPHRKHFLRGCENWLETSRIKPDIVIAKHWSATPIAERIARKYGARVIFDANELGFAEHDHDVRWRLTMRKAISAVEGKAVRNSDISVSVSDGYAEALKSYYGLEVSPTVIRNLPFSPPEKPKPLSDPIRFVLCGLARPDRNIKLLLDSAQNWQSNCKLVLQLVGHPRHIEAIRQMVEERNLEAKVEFVHPVGQSEIVNYLSANDVGLCILPINSEQTQCTEPNKLYQYLFAGLPVISSPLRSVGGVLSKHDCGVTLSRNEPDELSQTVNGWNSALYERLSSGVEAFQEKSDPMSDFSSLTKWLSEM